MHTLRSKRSVFPEGFENLQNRLILNKAREMGIDCELLVDGCEDFLKLSTRDKQIIINKTRTHRLPLIAGLLAKNKQACNLILHEQGMPVPSHIVITAMGEEAEQFLNEHSSIVVKPLDASSSQGVTLDVRNVAELETAIDAAAKHGSGIMLQQYVTGTDYRVLIINDQVAAVNQYRPVYVTGDGSSSVRELIEILNRSRIQDTEIGVYEAFPEIDPDHTRLLDALRKQGVALNDVPLAGQEIELYDLRNSAAGKISEFYRDCTDDIHPDNAHMMVQAARSLQIDVAGIDIRCKDIRVPMTTAQGGILEVNALPDLTHHVYPHGGTRRDVVRQYLEYLCQS
ncbi:Cyanophycin synthetase [Paenibacillus sp. JJ-100]|uniref:ATP-grasp domain-containing protein n=1 Tax=Paenibacillus sp. JJ-100 TaxID=2974896 RepID=UPI0022FF9A74|nr:ATP-grasp domain-containing protein [Paenibacillus sp. JJ-100]CAI6085236.1 Cyanophycin synthetase [Paenibacillus sp. JJ-100]